MQNEELYDLDRKTSKISALSSNNLDKYEYLTDEGLGLKPGTVEQAKFGYSALGKIFNKGLKEEDKKEGLLKRLKNIEKIKTRIIMIKLIYVLQEMNQLVLMNLKGVFILLV